MGSSSSQSILSTLPSSSYAQASPSQVVTGTGASQPLAVGEHAHAACLQCSAAERHALHGSLLSIVAGNWMKQHFQVII
eukprot:scaffold135463_cov22-Tisochrysis_lutea.AAC.1